MASSLLPSTRKRSRSDTEVLDSCTNLTENAVYFDSDSEPEKHPRIDDLGIGSSHNVSDVSLISEAVDSQTQIDSCLVSCESCSPNLSACGIDAFDELLNTAYQAFPNVLDNEKATQVAESCYGEDINCFLKNWEEDVSDVFSNISDFHGCNRPSETVSNSLDCMGNSLERPGEISRDGVEENWFFDALQQCDGEGPCVEALDVDWLTETLEGGNFYATSA